MNLPSDIEFEKADPPEELQPADEVDVGDEWRALKRIPDLMYKIYLGYGLEDSCLWSCVVHGSKQVAHYRGQWCWIYSFKELLYRGSTYNSLERRPEAFTPGKRFSTPIRGCFQTIEDAVVQLEKNRREHLKSMKWDLDRQTQAIEELERSVKNTRERLLSSRPITLEDLKKPVQT